MRIRDWSSDVCSSDLWALQEQIAGIIALEHDASDVTVVWLGDYVDRGWQPLQTLDLVAAGLGQPGVEEIRLLGNHEVYLIEAATGEDLSLPRLLNWWRYGGEIGRAHVGTQVTNAHLVCRLLLEKQKDTEEEHHLYSK